ncbi:MAG: HAMP domain-containing sensor histidine kinase [candidate division WOR-3 bacterium]
MNFKDFIRKSNFQTLLTLLIFILLLSIQYSEYLSKKKSFEKEFLNRSQIIAKIIDGTYKNVSSNMVEIEKFIFDEIFSEIDKTGRIYLSEKFSDIDLKERIESEGFSFSEKANKDSFVVIYKKDGKNIFRISKSKENFKTLSKKVGLKKYLDDLSSLPEIEYIVFQDNFGIFYASSNVKEFKSIFFDSLIMYSFMEKVDTFRVTTFKEKKIFEIIKPYVDENLIMRIGFGMDDLERLKKNSLTNFLTYLLFTISLYFLVVLILSIYSKNIILSQRLIEENSEKIKILSLVDEFIFIENLEKNILDDFDGKFEKVYKFSPLEIEQVKDIFENFKEVKNFQVSYKDYKFLVSSTKTSDNKKLVIYIKDITEFEKLKEEKKMMEFQSKLGELSYRISHELKNPLNGISIILQRMMKRDVLDVEESVMLKDAFDEVERMNKKIVEFTRFAKPYDYKFEKVSLKEILEDVVRSLKIFFDEKKMDVKIYLNDGDRFLSGDKEMLNIAFKNIILNGIEASFEYGRLDIIVDSFEGKILVQIKDYGQGIDEQESKKIFDLFYTTKENGSGIGLSTAKRIIEDHNGSITVESKKGEGTTIKIVMEEIKNG